MAQKRSYTPDSAEQLPKASKKARREVSLSWEKEPYRRRMRAAQELAPIEGIHD